MFSSRKTSAPASGGLLSKSLRFRSSASAYLSRTPGSTVTNNQKCTVSLWVKRGKLSTYTTQQILMYSALGDRIWFDVQASNTLSYYTPGVYANVTGLFADPSAWYHIVMAIDTTQATASNRVKAYVNGVQSTVTGAYPTLNQSIPLNTASTNQFIGGDGGSAFYDGYIADMYFIDGQALTPSSFGATNATTGQWSPAAYTGTYGLNGSHLTFANTTSTTTLGYDTSGNSNNWTTNNISLTAGATYDSMNDVPVAYSATAANYAVLNPLNASSNITISNGNLNFSYATAANISAYSTIGVSSGKWYTEVTWSAATSSTATVGITLQGYDSPAINIFAGSSLYSYGYDHDGRKYNNASSSTYGATFTSNDVIGMAFDASAGTLTFYKNGTSQGTAFTSIPSGTYFITVSAGGTTTTTCSVNFGQQPFTYTPPSGFVALNTYNLPTPTIAQGNKYMDATTYTGNGTSQTITNAGLFQPDFIWAKERSAARVNCLTDSVRGFTKYLYSDLTNAEETYSIIVTSVNSNGFNVGTSVAVNDSGQTYVAWQWKASNATAVSNTSGTITSSVSANTTAGFSIVTYTGNGTQGATVGHGIGATPYMIITFNRTSGGNHVVYHVSLTTAYFLRLNTTDAQVSASSVYPNAPSSSTFTIGNDSSVNTTSANYVAYCFTPIAGFSAFGSYTGNGSATGPFIYTGFQPKYLLVKRTDSTSDWYIWDSVRNTFNIVTNTLLADTAGAETSASSVNILSNGFQCVSSTVVNASGGTYIYAAFASNPFKYSNAF